MIFEFLIAKYYSAYTHKKRQSNTYLSFSNKELPEVLNELKADTYYLINESRVIWIGKKYKYVGETQKMTFTETCNYLKTKVYEDWCRRFYLVPTDGENKAIYINEEGCFVLITPLDNEIVFEG